MKTHKETLSSYGEVTAGRFAEMLIAEVLGGRIVDKTGYDLQCNDGRRIEVRSRVEGTDSKTPRVTLSKAKMKESTDVVAVRFNSKYKPIEARLVSTAALVPLYERYRQSNGSTAHIDWSLFCSSPGAVDLLPKVIALYDALDA